ncbi:DUF885 domain-containing protein [Streptomyces sp. CBMA29]|uniref:DUF885 domain-containing protein n=1 Tax=Streptomyces sp. CBMA29 TaxID=1896314 RepID=UPI001661FCF8|nr:DUF885 domain-containing protein [Streptomyces sp. CBMA29]MBD0739250.1 hypothetical protein [Streptomyces sp. CBMA29]
MTATSDLADAYQALLIRDDPVYAVMAGTPPQSLAPLDETTVRERATTARNLLDRLDATGADVTEADTTGVDGSEADLASVLRAMLTADIEQSDLMWQDHLTAPYHANFLFAMVARMAIAPRTGVERTRLTAEFAERVRSAAKVLREQRKRGFALPEPAVDGARRTWTALTAEMSALLDSPAVDAAMDAVGTEIETAAGTGGDAVGMAHVPGGEAAYRLLVRQHTTLDLGPEELHRLGLAQCAELAERMAEIRARLGGPADEDRARTWLSAQEHLYASTPDAVAAAYRRHMARAEPGIDALFRTRPRAGYDVQRLDPADEDGMTYGYYAQPTLTQPVGLYRFNGSDLADRSLLTSAALILHELVPGHHFHLAVQAENTALHPLQRHAPLGAFTEGWGEYGSHLGWELGAYDDDWDAYGRLAHERFTAQRLVVDTALNLGHWDLARARAFMRANTLDSDRQIASETLRYATDLPAQALAYRSGFLAFQQARESAAGIDPRVVHDAMLTAGAVPLPRMRERVALAVRRETAASGVRRD